MGFRCLLGHDFGEPKLTRTQEEQGDEVIISVSEIKTCQKCGATRVVSENTEVTTIEQLTATATGSPPAEPTAQPTNQGQPAADTTQPASDTTAQPTDETAGQSATETTTQPAAETPQPAQSATTDEQPSEPTQWSEPTDTASPTEAENAHDVEQTGPSLADIEEEQDAATDDGIILPNEREQPAERQPGEWPDFDGDQHTGDETATREPTAWPEQTGEDTGYDATTPADDDSAGPEGVSFSGGFTPKATKPTPSDGDDGVELLVDEPSDDEATSERDVDPDTEDDDEDLFTRADEADAFEPTVDDIETEFFCPECGLTRVSGVSSMRAGDICPECKRGYIAERPL